MIKNCKILSTQGYDATVLFVTDANTEFTQVVSLKPYAKDEFYVDENGKTRANLIKVDPMDDVQEYLTNYGNAYLAGLEQESADIVDQSLVGVEMEAKK